MIEYKFVSGTCSDATPVNGRSIYITQQQLPNGTYPVGTRTDFTCNKGYVYNYQFAVVCVQPGIWIPRAPRCFPANQCE